MRAHSPFRHSRSANSRLKSLPHTEGVSFVTAAAWVTDAADGAISVQSGHHW